MRFGPDNDIKNVLESVLSLSDGWTVESRLREIFSIICMSRYHSVLSKVRQRSISSGLDTCYQSWSSGQLMVWIHRCAGQGTRRLRTFVSLGWASSQTKLRHPCHFKGVYYFLVKSKGRNITDERRLEQHCKPSCTNQVKMEDKDVNHCGLGSFLLQNHRLLKSLCAFTNLSWVFETPVWLIWCCILIIQYYLLTFWH